MDLPRLSVKPRADGVWSVDERGPDRVAISYFRSKVGAMRHAVRVARAKGRCRISVLEADGRERLSRTYPDQRNPTDNVEVP